MSAEDVKKPSTLDELLEKANFEVVYLKDMKQRLMEAMGPELAGRYQEWLARGEAIHRDLCEALLFDGERSLVAASAVMSALPRYVTEGVFWRRTTTRLAASLPPGVLRVIPGEKKP